MIQVYSVKDRTEAPDPHFVNPRDYETAADYVLVDLAYIPVLVREPAIRIN